MAPVTKWVQFVLEHFEADQSDTEDDDPDDDTITEESLAGYNAAGLFPDVEDEHNGAEPQGDEEPSLGWPNNFGVGPGCTDDRQDLEEGRG